MQEIVTDSVLLRPDIDPEMASPYLALMEKRALWGIVYAGLFCMHFLRKQLTYPIHRIREPRR